jgi:hypothetical protein
LWKDFFSNDEADDEEEDDEEEDEEEEEEEEEGKAEEIEGDEKRFLPRKVEGGGGCFVGEESCGVFGVLKGDRSRDVGCFIGDNVKGSSSGISSLQQKKQKKRANSKKGKKEKKKKRKKRTAQEVPLGFSQ